MTTTNEACAPEGCALRDAMLLATLCPSLREGRNPTLGCRCPARYARWDDNPGLGFVADLLCSVTIKRDRRLIELYR